MPTAHLVCDDSRDEKRLRQVSKAASDSGQQPRSVRACSRARPDGRPDLTREISSYMPGVTR